MERKTLLSKSYQVYVRMANKRAKQEHVMKSFKFRLHPTKAQQAKLDDSINACRLMYNEFVSESRLAYRGRLQGKI